MSALFKFAPLLLILVVMLAGIYIVGNILLLRKRIVTARRRSPLSVDLLRPPGYFISTKLDEVQDDITIWLCLLTIGPLALYAAHITQSYLMNIPETPARIIMSVLAGLVFVVFAGWKLFRLVRERENLSLGLEAERAVAEALNRLMRRGDFVFHDVPGDGFNIDHVVVSKAGVFAIETKGRAKRISKNGRNEARVWYDGKRLHFPDRTEVEPLEQAERQAKWLKSWLTRAVGEPVDVCPVVALPGWFVEAPPNPVMPVINPKMSESTIYHFGRQRLDQPMMARIAHQLDQRCRTVSRVLAPSRSA
jgi:Nuclease-related domain.